MVISCSLMNFHVLQDSLAAEIEGTMRKELSLDDPECEDQKYELSSIFYTQTTADCVVDIPVQLHVFFFTVIKN